MRDREDAPLHEAGAFKGPYPSGAPAICIDTAARLGSRTAVIGGVGQDDFGKCLLDRLNDDGVDTSRVIESKEASTGCAFVTYFSDGSRKFIFHMGNTPAVQAKAPKKGTLDARYMHIMGCSLMADKVFAQEILKTMRMLRNGGTAISFDPNIRNELFTDDSINAVIQEVMENTSVFLPGVEELLLVTGADDVETGIRRCFEYENMEIVCLKNGSKGSRIYTRDGMMEVGVYKVKQADATGAGDSYRAGYYAALYRGHSVHEALVIGSSVASFVVEATGALTNIPAWDDVMARAEPYLEGI
jgi:sugar/nucleoside kinase (ribokinase family)